MGKKHTSGSGTRESLHSFVQDGVKYIPISMSNAGENDPGIMDEEEFKRMTYKMTDAELNDYLYRQAKEYVESGLAPSWPKNDFGIQHWFVFSFITDEMRQVFPEIAKEYLSHEPMLGTAFTDIPYPRMNETTWDDAFFFRVLAIMVTAARRGSVYSRNFLISLYKVYYKPEYNRIKRLKKLTYLDVLQLHDADCLRRGLPSGHAVDGGRTFRDYMVDERRHQAGWMDVAGTRSLEPVMQRHRMTADEKADRTEEQRISDEKLETASEYLRDVADFPDEPPLDPTSARLYIMCDMLVIPIDETCNADAEKINEGRQSVLDAEFVGNPEFRRVISEEEERAKEWVLATYPETADPYLYQTDQKYVGLELAESVLWQAFRKQDRNIRMPYDSKKFDLAELLASVTITKTLMFPNVPVSFDEVMMLSMVQYLCECLCDLMITRDRELNDLLKFSEQKHTDEWHEERNQTEQAEKALKAVEGLRSTEFAKQEPVYMPVAETHIDETDTAALKAEIGRLQVVLAEKEAALSESEQKVIQQRHLYEQARKQAEDQQDRLDSAATEHAELIALREYVYSLRDEREIELDEEKQEQMVAALQDKNVAVLGGTERWTKRMRRLFPKWKFISVEDDSIGGYNALEGASYIYIYTSAIKHSVYYRAMNLIRKSGKMLFFLGSTNTEENIVRFCRDLCR